MIETALIDLPQFNVYHNSLQPIAHYYHEHSKAPLTDKEIDKLLPYARQTDFILKTFSEIVDDLTYDKEKFESIIYSFDDDYDMLKDFISNLNPLIKSHKELLKISDNILSNLIQAQNDLGIIISQHEHKRV
ncbi:MAG: hypothetical protein PHO65_01615 [Sulfurovum sp.]|nr:hypothetical protein [Sulfurovum sp.]